MAINIQLRRGLASEWTASNPTLAVAELALETDTGQIKIGDGATAWTSLAYGGIEGPSGVAAATSPLAYNAGTQTVSIDLSSYDTSSEVDTKVATKVSQTDGTVTTATETSTVVRNITLSTSTPTGGSDGDVWLVYTA